MSALGRRFATDTDPKLTLHTAGTEDIDLAQLEFHPESPLVRCRNKFRSPGPEYGGARGLIAPIFSITRDHLQGPRITVTFEEPVPFGDRREIAIPQPSTLAIFAFGLAGFGFMTWRRRTTLAG